MTKIENDIAKVLLSIGDYPTYIQFKIVSCRFYLIFFMVGIISLFLKIPSLALTVPILLYVMYDNSAITNKLSKDLNLL